MPRPLPAHSSVPPARARRHAQDSPAMPDPMAALFMLASSGELR